jgi:hypothetical protein
MHVCMHVCISDVSYVCMYVCQLCMCVCVSYVCKAGCTRNERSTKIWRGAQAKYLTILQTYHVAKVKSVREICHVPRWKNHQRLAFRFGPPFPNFAALISSAPSFMCVVLYMGYGCGGLHGDVYVERN